MFKQDSDPTTRQLSEATFTLVPRAGGRHLFRTITAVLFCAAACAWLLLTDSGKTAEKNLGEELRKSQEINARQNAEITELKMLLEHERAIRAAIERDSAQQAEALKQANKTLTFYRNQSGSTPLKQ